MNNFLHNFHRLLTLLQFQKSQTLFKTISVVGALASSFRANHQSENQTIGAGSLNQAMKAMVLARGYLKQDGIDVIFYPEFVDLDFDGRIVTAIKLIIENRS